MALWARTSTWGAHPHIIPLPSIHSKKPSVPVLLPLFEMDQSLPCFQNIERPQRKVAAHPATSIFCHAELAYPPSLLKAASGKTLGGTGSGKPGINNSGSESLNTSSIRRFRRESMRAENPTFERTVTERRLSRLIRSCANSRDEVKWPIPGEEMRITSAFFFISRIVLPFGSILFAFAVNFYHTTK
ncbi:hypothetical protein CR513_40398, partial [Mucuna pruriens]